MNELKREVPSHVPAKLVFDFDYYHGPEVTNCPHQSLPALHQWPDIFYTPHNNGHWVVTRINDAVEFLQTPELFSNDPNYADASFNMTAVRRIPLDLDPPEHTIYRRLLNPLFSPAAIARLEQNVRGFARRLVDTVADKGECDFIAQIAKLYPPEIFLWLMGIAPERRQEFVGWVDTWFRSAVPEVARAASQKVSDFIRSVLEERQKSPADDLLSQLLKMRVEGRLLGIDELVGIGVLLFIGGLDTVIASLSFIIQFLASSPEHTRILAENPARISDAMEEILRRHTISMVYKNTTRDVTFKNIDFKKGDRILFTYPLFGLDDREVKDPLKVDFDRSVSRHLAFSAGPHRCLGSHLARLEIRVFLEEWLQRIPRFCLKPDNKLQYRGGKIIELAALPLVWDIA